MYILYFIFLGEDSSSHCEKGGWNNDWQFGYTCERVSLGRLEIWVISPKISHCGDSSVRKGNKKGEQKETVAILKENNEKSVQETKQIS